MVTSSSNQIIYLVQFLSKIAFFENLSHQTLNQLARSLNKQTFHDGDYIIRQDEIGDRFYIINNGKVRITRSCISDYDNGDRLPLNSETRYKEVLITVLGEGEVFGEKSLIRKETRTANCIAAEPCELFYLNKQDFSTILGEIFDKFVELDEFRTLRMLPIFSKLSSSRLHKLKEFLQYKTFYCGDIINCDGALIYIVMEGYIETNSGVKFGPKLGLSNVLGDLKASSDKSAFSFTVTSTESKIGLLKREQLFQLTVGQENFLSSNDDSTQNVERNIKKSIEFESLQSEFNIESLKIRRLSTAQKRHFSIDKTIFITLNDLEVIKPLGHGTFG